MCRLTPRDGGHAGGVEPSLGRAEEVVAVVLAEPEVLECFLVDDEIMDMRASDALEKVAATAPILLPYRERLPTRMGSAGRCG